MSFFQLTELSLSTISQAILLFFIALYLTLARDKKSTTYWLALTCWSGFVAALLFFFVFSVPNLTGWSTLVRWTAYSTLSIVPIPLIQFLYRYPAVPVTYQLERRLAFLLTAGASGVMFLLMGASFFGRVNPNISIFHAILLIEVAWAGILVVRRYVTFQFRRSGNGPHGRSVLGSLIDNPITGSFHLQLMAAGLVCSSALLWAVIRIDSWPYFAFDNVVSFSLFFLFPLIVFPYLIYSEQDHTLQFIFTGSVLLTVFMVLTISVLVFTASYRRGYRNLELLDSSRTFEFKRLSNQVYRITPTSSAIDFTRSENISRAVIDQEPIDLGFTFPFFGQDITEIYISPNQGITFDEPFHLERFQSGDQAGIAPLIIQSTFPSAPDIGAEISSGIEGVFLSREEDKLTIWWMALKNSRNELIGGSRVELFDDGTIVMRISEPIPHGLYSRHPLSAPWMIGIQSGADEGEIVRLALNEGDLPPLETPLARAILEDYNHGYRQTLHELLVPFFWITISATILIITFFPLLVISTVTRPIHEIVSAINLLKEIRYGRELVPLTVRSNNELGYLRERYNLAAATLSDQLLATQAEKRALTRKLEELVIELKETRREVNKASKLADMANELKSQFVTNLSHEIRTPLNAIIGYSDIMIEDAIAEDKESWVSDFNKIKKSAMSLLNMINDILDMSKIESGKVTVYMEAFNIEELIREVAEMMTPIAEESQNVFKFDIQAQERRMISDYIKIRQIFQNLLGNANKFTKRGVILIRISKDSDGEKRPFFNIQVADTGIGMSEEQVSRIFAPFQQADNSISRKYGGSGLGLAITHQLCKILGGQITVKSQQGRGSVFTVKLPVSLTTNDIHLNQPYTNGSHPDGLPDKSSVSEATPNHGQL